MNNNNSFCDYISETLDKFNIQLEVTQSELREKLSLLSDKIIRYEIITSVVAIILMILLIVTSIIVSNILLKSYEKLSMHKRLKDFMHKDFESKKEYVKNKYALIVLAIRTFIVIIALLNIIFKIINLIECLLFPEKAVLEFIGRYL